MNVRPIAETCRIRQNLNLLCFGCPYKGETCENFKTLLEVRKPADVAVLPKYNGGKRNDRKRKVNNM